MVRTSHFLATAAVIADALPLAVAMPMQTMATNVLPNFSLSGMSNLLAFAQFMGGPRGPGDARPRPVGRYRYFFRPNRRADQHVTVAQVARHA
jgi:hypothetical protein